MPNKLGHKNEPNKLINEKSPYLLQHAYNPVNWRAWNNEAFEEAKNLDRPVFLSIGYSTCHWCHVMEKESFEDPHIAGMMNDAFVNIKVDREERPDIDSIYMTVCQMLTNGGGWPLTIIMAPGKEPFFAGTYIPKESKWGRMGMEDLINRVNELWAEDRQKILDSAKGIAERLKFDYSKTEKAELRPEVVENAYHSLSRSYDVKYSGFGSSPKFPMPQNLIYLLRYWKLKGIPYALEMAEKTLKEMRYGGIYDHIGFGFHRYSTDAHWLLPHFEKMLYDQASLCRAYSEAYMATNNSFYKKTASEIIEYVSGYLKSHEGAFYSAEDADSEGVEGKFYVWGYNEIADNIEDADFILDVFNSGPRGNFVEETSTKPAEKNILHFAHSPEALAEKHKLSKDEFSERLEAARQKLLDIRNKRVRPSLDDKILTDWNGLMISSMAYAGRVFGRPEFIESAETAAAYIMDIMGRDDGKLLHRYRDGEAAINGMIDDYAFFVYGLIELYRATFKVRYLAKAAKYSETLENHFYDKENGGFFMSPDYGETVIARRKEYYDGATPSGASVAINNFIRLFKLTGKMKYKDIAEKSLESFSQFIAAQPAGYINSVGALTRLAGDSTEIVICGNPESGETLEFIREINSRYMPEAEVILKPAGAAAEELESISPFIKPQKQIGGKTTAYVCKNFACSKPVNTFKEFREILNDSGGGNER